MPEVPLQVFDADDKSRIAVPESAMVVGHAPRAKSGNREARALWWRDLANRPPCGGEVVLLQDQEEVLNQTKERLNLITCYQVLVFG